MIVARSPVRLTDLSLSRGEAPFTKRQSGVRPCVSGGKSGFSPGPPNGAPVQ